MKSRAKIPGLCALLTLASLARCGSETPMAPSAPAIPPLQQATFSYVRETELNVYLVAIGRTVPDFQLVVAEQTVLFGDWTEKKTNTYWTRVYANNLVLRIRAYTRGVATVHPSNPELEGLHDGFVDGLGILESAISDFSDALDPLDGELIDQANEKIGRFNIAMDLYMGRLSSLAGQPIQLFPIQ